MRESGGTRAIHVIGQWGTSQDRKRYESRLRLLLCFYRVRRDMIIQNQFGISDKYPVKTLEMQWGLMFLTGGGLWAA